ncbi:unnamed protein product [Linum tenue]|uniref:Uncharacterized protein n=1 Tax=Linum tenue TaxID=586396 RepID=A0AAV0LIC8_9ROSI|nr:unnamed protein product [Linum tenue]
MKRAIPWSDDDEGKDSPDSDDESSTSSSASDSEGDGGTTKTKTKNALKHKNLKGKFVRRRGGAVDFEELRRHGYKGGPSLLRMPPPKDDTEPNWTWSTGKEERLAATKDKNGESYEERQKTRAALMAGEQLMHSQTRKEKEEKNQLSFSQKEKRKRELGQASRGKNYVEEEKRLLRDSGVYSGFDT